jgi:hypothetical protein
MRPRGHGAALTAHDRDGRSWQYRLFGSGSLRLGKHRRYGIEADYLEREGLQSFRSLTPKPVMVRDPKWLQVAVQRVGQVVACLGLDDLWPELSEGV